MNKFDLDYQKLLVDIINNGIEETNHRTGHKTKALPGMNIQIDIEKDGFPALTLRKQPLKSPIAEQIWFIGGSNRPDNFLNKHTKIWNAFTEENGEVASAYGYRWKKHFGKDQIESVIKLLKGDNSSRHGVVITWDPKDDGFDGTPKKNVPCPYTFTVNIIGGRLNLHNIVRSNDMILGFPFDVFGFALLLCILAQEIGVKPGVYTHSISNAHIYDIHYEIANELIKREINHDKIILSLPKDSYNRAKQYDDLLLKEIFNNINNQYKPLEAINNIDIVL